MDVSIVSDQKQVLCTPEIFFCQSAAGQTEPMKNF